MRPLFLGRKVRSVQKAKPSPHEPQSSSNKQPKQTKSIIKQTTSAINQKVTVDAFSPQIKREFTEGSAIALAQFQAAIALVRDTAILDGGEVSYPIVQLTGLKVLALLSPLQRLDWSLSSNSVPIRLSEMHAIMEQFIVSYEPRGPSPPTANNQPLRPLFSVKSTCEVSAL